MSVLADFRWLRGRIDLDGRSSVVLDCTTALDARVGFSGGLEKSIRALQQSLMLVGDGASTESDGTLAGSLIQVAQSSVDTGCADQGADLFDKVVSSTESLVGGAWVKPISRCSRARDQCVLSQAVVGSGGRVLGLTALGDDEGHFVSGSTDGVVRVHESEYLGTVLDLKGHADEVNRVEVAKKNGVENLFFIFSASEDGTVRSWEVSRDTSKGVIEKARAVVGVCESGVWCMSVSKGGDLVVGGCHSGLVFIWKRVEDGHDALLFEPVTSFRCSEVGKGTGWIRGVSVSPLGNMVVAGEEKGGIAFWNSSESEVEGTVVRSRASDESGAMLRAVLLSEDESSVSFIFAKPVGCEVWDVASRTRSSPRVSLSESKSLTCATILHDWDKSADATRNGAADVIVAGAWDERVGGSISLYWPTNCFDVNSLDLLSTLVLASTPRSLCQIFFAGEFRILAGSDDGCIRMLDTNFPVASHGGNPDGEGTLSQRCARNEALDASDLIDLSTISIMPIAGHVVAGHTDGYFSIWQVENGEFVRAFEGARGNSVNCVDIFADEKLAVSGHGGGVALVWDATMWECSFALEGHSDEIVCATISVDAKWIVTVDWNGQLRVWNAQWSGAALWKVETGLKFSLYGSRGAISLDGGLFVWAIRNGHDQKWRGTVLKLGKIGDKLQAEGARHFEFDSLLRDLISTMAFDGEDELRWKYGAVHANRLMRLGVTDFGKPSADMWHISSGEDRGFDLPGIDCALLSTDRAKALPAVASLRFDSAVASISAGWIPGKRDGCRRAVVACWLRGRCWPAIMHLYLGKD